jgi:hypothetical protein
VDVVPTDENGQLAHAEVVAVHADRLDHREERNLYSSTFGRWCRGGILHGEGGVELSCLRQLAVSRVAERHPNEAIGPAHVVVDLVRE